MRITLYLSLLILSSPLNCWADESGLTQGTWPGSISLPGKKAEPAHINVLNKEDADNKSHTDITMYVDETPLEFIDLKIRKNTLHFNIDTGTLNQCVLNKHKDGVYSGFCKTTGSDYHASRLALKLRPPSQKETPVDTSLVPTPGNESDKQ
jgi:hypothetical protein